MLPWPLVHLDLLDVVIISQVEVESTDEQLGANTGTPLTNGYPTSIYLVLDHEEEEEHCESEHCDQDGQDPADLDPFVCLGPD